MYRACWLLLCLLAGSQAVSVEVFTVPAAVAAGDSVTLRCLASSTADDPLAYVKWWWLPRASGERHIIYQHIIGRQPQPVSTYLSVAVLNPEDNGIQVSDLKPIHSGTFICEAASTYNEVRKQQPLIVYSPGTGPQLNASAVPDGPDAGDEPDVRVVCEAHDVAPFPELQLTVDGEELKVPSKVSDSVAGVYDVEVTATFSAEAVEGKEVRCELLYRDEVTHPVYRDLLVYQPSGGEEASTPAPEGSTEDSPPSEDTTGGGSRPSGLWIFLLSAAIPVCFASLL